MVDFGRITKDRNLDGLLGEKLRAGDIYTHCYSGHRLEVLPDNKVNPAMVAGRQRGIFFDIGFGAASFYWYVAVPSYEQKFYPDSISTDLHVRSMNAYEGHAPVHGEDHGAGLIARRRDPHVHDQSGQANHEAAVGEPGPRRRS